MILAGRYRHVSLEPGASTELQQAFSRSLTGKGRAALSLTMGLDSAPTRASQAIYENFGSIDLVIVIR